MRDTRREPDLLGNLRAPIRTPSWDPFLDHLREPFPGTPPGRRIPAFAVALREPDLLGNLRASRHNKLVHQARREVGARQEGVPDFARFDPCGHAPFPYDAELGPFSGWAISLRKKYWILKSRNVANTGKEARPLAS